MKYLTFIFLIFVVGCDLHTPLPTKCREVGVNVSDQDTITGTILNEYIGDLQTVQKQCQDSLTQRKYGCTIAVSPGKYVLWFVDKPNERDHERCHALYEEWKHTK